jgi:hypothetical protein
MVEDFEEKLMEVGLRPGDGQAAVGCPTMAQLEQAN